ncbi:hypothetical protein [Rhizobium sp. MHM7A]|nr:hypothetical protein [Rhizobium sp. MHM7A]
MDDIITALDRVRPAEVLVEAGFDEVETFGERLEARRDLRR